MNLEETGVANGPDKLQSSRAWMELEEGFLANGDASVVLSGLAAAADAIAVSAYQASIEPALPQGAVLLAAGALGRRELFPFSDLDVLIVLEEESPWVALRDVLSAFVRRLWDAGLRVNHSVRMIGECLDAREQNAGLLLKLLDRRFLAGDAEVHSKLEAALEAFLSKHAPRLSQQIAESARLGHARFEHTTRHAQPDVQDGPGGLGDLLLIERLSKLGAALEPLSHELDRAAAWLSAARCFLHYQARGDRNLLDLEAQQRMAALPFARVASRAAFMREFYAHAEVVFSEARRALEAPAKSDSSLLDSFRDWRSRLSNNDFTVSRERVLLRNPAQLGNDPSLVFRLLEFIGRHNLAPAFDTERRLEAARAAFAIHCAATSGVWPALKNVLAQPHAALALGTLGRSGLMTALLPEWAAIENRVPSVAGHSYTVDEEAVLAVARAGELQAPADDPSRQRFSRLYSEIDNPALLALALLVKDLGREEGEGDPPRRPAELARQAMARLGVPPDERDLVAFLIEHQLDLADAMSGRDLDDPQTARLLADRVGTVERLKLLVALTYAAIAASAPEAITAWRMERLWRVYEIAQRELTRELETDRIQVLPPHLAGRGDFLKGFPVRYLRAHSPAQIEGHLRLYELSRPTGVALELARLEGAWQLTLVARDMSFLFASLAGAISSFGLDILKAEAFSNAKAHVLDTFVFADPKRTLDLNPGEVERLEDMLRRVATGKTDARRLLRHRAQPDPKRRTIQPKVRFDAEACATATLVEIETEDRPGLLYSLAMAFSSTACNIDIVLIDTKGHRAIDVFYVSYEGGKLAAGIEEVLKQKLLAAC